MNVDPDLGEDWDADGYYVQAGYQVLPQKLELAARFTKVKFKDANASARFDKGQTQLRAATTFASIRPNCRPTSTS